ncbi:putative enoyl-CoA hydratase (plasmid) [Acidiphilium multivorum AIU301]|uniref:Putative enoyl-CoA hydratase n=1 Tax=Acidiphilium multivorum (strain DSM 11245 / JCM 8867 / NBRC 100883 / AIU 301) TaxID=926570 RepID=F0J7G6_ACIMA|nr:putative enoyl-CoA hydratase [Acidiphilium multivorum AIU301]
MSAAHFPIAIEDNVAILKLNRATCLDVAGKHALTEALDILKGREDLRALVIAGEHPQAFLVNVAELADMSAQSARNFSASGHALAAALEALPFPAVAVVEGPALGGGCEVVLACDIAFAGRGASFGQIEALGGVMPAFGGSWRLARRVGYARALEMMFTAAVIDAETAKAYGLVLETAERGGALDAAKAFARRLSPTRAASVAAIKAAAIFGWNRSPADINRFEEDRFATLFGPEQSQRMHAFLARQQEPAKP